MVPELLNSTEVFLIPNIPTTDEDHSMLGTKSSDTCYPWADLCGCGVSAGPQALAGGRGAGQLSGSTLGPTSVSEPAKEVQVLRTVPSGVDGDRSDQRSEHPLDLQITGGKVRVGQSNKPAARGKYLQCVSISHFPRAPSCLVSSEYVHMHAAESVMLYERLMPPDKMLCCMRGCNLWELCVCGGAIPRPADLIDTPTLSSRAISEVRFTGKSRTGGSLKVGESPCQISSCPIPATLPVGLFKATLPALCHNLMDSTASAHRYY